MSTDTDPSPAARDISARARRFVDGEGALPYYIVEHFRRNAVDAWDAETNPLGYVGLCMAENKLCNAALRDRLAVAAPSAPLSSLCYEPMTGSKAFRAALSKFMARKLFCGHAFAVDEIAVLAGVGSVIEQLFYALCDPGDGVLVPTPSYMGFWPDLERRDELVVVPVKCDSASGFELSTALLDAAVAESPRPVRALLFTNPDNPKGTIASASQIRELVQWTAARGIHVVFDEIYALSVFEPGARFVSVASVLGGVLPPHVHIVWGFSKDFGCSGLRCGVLVSQNARVLAAVDGLAYWAVTSGHTQSLLAEIITDEQWVDGFLQDSCAALAAVYRSVTSLLRAAAIPFVHASGGVFVLIDLRAHLRCATWDAERELAVALLEVNAGLTPGEFCRVIEPGWFRVCYAAVSPAAVEAAIGRVVDVLAARRAKAASE